MCIHSSPGEEGTRVWSPEGRRVGDEGRIIPVISNPQILESTASYEGLRLIQAEVNQHRLQAEGGLGTALDNQVLRPTGISNFPQSISPEQYYFGRGLVNVAAAVEQAKAIR